MRDPEEVLERAPEETGEDLTNCGGFLKLAGVASLGSCCSALLSSLPFNSPSERVGTRTNEARRPEEEEAFRGSPQSAGRLLSGGVRAKEGCAEGLMARGTVKWFNEDKGYGFISPDEGGEDLFVHYTGIEGEGYRSLEEGERVSYEPTRGRKGEQAENVRKVE